MTLGATTARALWSSAKGDWLTPPDQLDLARQVAPIALDPCTTAENPTGAARFFTPADNGLKQNWHGAIEGVPGLVFVNPPFGKGIDEWVTLCLRTFERGRDVLALLPGRTDSRWFQDSVPTAAAVCFWRGRLRFVGAPSSAPFPTVFAFWSSDAAAIDRFEAVYEKNPRTGLTNWITRLDP